MKENKTIRGAQYYITVATKIMAHSAVVTRKQLLDIFNEVDKEQGYPTSEVKQKYTMLDKFEKIFQSGGKLIKSMEKIPDAERGRGQRLKQENYAIDEMSEKELTDYVENYYRTTDKRKKKKAISCPVSVTGKDRQIRDASVRASEELREHNPGLAQKESMEEAKKSIKLTKKDVKRAWGLLRLGRDNGEWIVNRDTLVKTVWNGKQVSKKGLEQLCKKLGYYGIRLFIQFIDAKKRGWNIKLMSEPSEIMEKLKKVAFEVTGVTLIDEGKKRVEIGDHPSQRLVRIENSTDDSSSRFSYTKRLIFYIGGIIMMRDGKAINATQLCNILENNSYFKIKEGPQAIFSLIKQFPEFFERSQGSDRNAISFAVCYKKNEIWSKLKNLCSPKYHTKEIPWLIQSGLSLEEIRSFFPESYIECPEYNKSVITIKMTESIKDFMALAQLHQKMRDCDVPLGQEPCFCNKLSFESKIQNARIRTIYANPTQEWVQRTEGMQKDKNFENDKLLYHIEEML